MSKELKKCNPCSKTRYHSPPKPCTPCGDYCVNRNFRDKSSKLRCILGKLQFEECPHKPRENVEEVKYKTANYNGLYHKGLNHNLVDGRLVSNTDYEDMRDALVYCDQQALGLVPPAPGAEVKQANPLASCSTIIVGAPQCTLKIATPPTLSSDSGAADMVEVYAHVIARDVGFIDYATDATITTLLGNTQLNAPNVLANLLYKPAGAFTAKTIFRGPSSDELIGPYISQLLYLDVPMGAIKLVQKYTTLVARSAAVSRVEWGVSPAETISIQNTVISTLPALNPADVDPTKRYIFSGRSLAEAVHADPAYQFYYNAALTLLGLGVKANPGFPVLANQSSFITGSAGPSVTCAVAEVAGLALKHAWFWKWQCFRKLRPEAFGMWVHDVKAGLVPNVGNFDLSDVVLNNSILTDILNLNTTVYSNASYTLPLCYREGSPTHPSYPAGHAAIAGACVTVLKMFFDAEKPWNSLPGVQTGSLAPLAGVVQANASGSALVAYAGLDANSLSIWGELNKLASNVSIGRDWSGVHYRSDGIQGMVLGEQVAIHYMQDFLSTCIENNADGSIPQITFRKFDGTFYTVKPTLCKGRC